MEQHFEMISLNMLVTRMSPSPSPAPNSINKFLIMFAALEINLACKSKRATAGVEFKGVGCW